MVKKPDPSRIRQYTRTYRFFCKNTYKYSIIFTFMNKYTYFYTILTFMRMMY
nr:MAG TPA: hypothetical protein [Caudoviricetes sp.]